MLWHRPSMGVARSRFWVLYQVITQSQCECTFRSIPCPHPTILIFSRCSKKLKWFSIDAVNPGIIISFKFNFIWRDYINCTYIFYLFPFLVSSWKSQCWRISWSVQRCCVWIQGQYAKQVAVVKGPGAQVYFESERNWILCQKFGFVFQNIWFFWWKEPRVWNEY